jgi:predicted AlkP superfamily pyrophosphatase or phosphodiesterase
MRSFALAFLALAVVCRTDGSAGIPPATPKLVVVIVIDQFRPDYLSRFRSYFGSGGFNLFLQRGASFPEARYRHGITQTCPGHAVILTGSYADVNGIIANSWYDASAGREEYCAADSTARLLGSTSEGRSPRNLIGSTIGDELKLATAGRSRVITISGKDRAAIMLGGHVADAAYWTEDTLFVSSTYYMKQLPPWVQRFNASKAVTAYAGKTWDRLLPPSAYQIVGPDDVAAEDDVAGMGRTFPHRLGKGRVPTETFMTAFQNSPFENEVIVDFALQAVAQEGLGRDRDPDLLAIGFSANDLIGHAFGPDSHEVMDVTIRTDRLLERLFSSLDQQVGLDSVLIVLTADHGVAPLPELVRRLKPGVDAGRLDPAIIGEAAEAALRAAFGEPKRGAWVVYQGWPSLYLDTAGLKAKGISIDQAEAVAKAAVQKVPGVQQGITASELRQQRNLGMHTSAELSFYPSRSGNIYYQLVPNLLPERQRAGTTHGSPWAYDTHVPLLWFGPGIHPGVYRTPASVSDLAPTLSALLGIPEPSGSRGRVLEEMLR